MRYCHQVETGEVDESVIESRSAISLIELDRDAKRFSLVLKKLTQVFLFDIRHFVEITKILMLRKLRSFSGFLAVTLALQGAVVHGFILFYLPSTTR
jgi:hypothetical protein